MYLGDTNIVTDVMALLGCLVTGGGGFNPQGPVWARGLNVESPLGEAVNNGSSRWSHDGQNDGDAVRKKDAGMQFLVRLLACSLVRLVREKT